MTCTFERSAHSVTRKQVARSAHAPRNNDGLTQVIRRLSTTGRCRALSMQTRFAVSKDEIVRSVVNKTTLNAATRSFFDRTQSHQAQKESIREGEVRGVPHPFKIEFAFFGEGSRHGKRMKARLGCTHTFWK